MPNDRRIIGNRRDSFGIEETPRKTVAQAALERSNTFKRLGQLDVANSEGQFAARLEAMSRHERPSVQ